MPYRRNLIGATLAGLTLAAGLSAAVAAQPAGLTLSRTKLMLSEGVSREVEQDTLVAIVTARGSAASPSEAQATVNTTMLAAVEQAKTVEAVRRATGGYRVYQERDRNAQPRGWVAEQDLRLTSKEAGALLELVGNLQARGLAVGGLSYILSAEARRGLENELTVEALAALRKRAERVAEAMAMRVEAIDTIRLGGVGDEPGFRPMMRAAAADAAPPPPPLALPDLETVRLSVDAEVILSPR